MNNRIITGSKVRITLEHFCQMFGERATSMLRPIVESEGEVYFTLNGIPVGSLQYEESSYMYSLYNQDGKECSKSSAFKRVVYDLNLLLLNR